MLQKREYRTNADDVWLYILELKNFMKWSPKQDDIYKNNILKILLIEVKNTVGRIFYFN